jgi:hypothetical protein
VGEESYGNWANGWETTSRKWELNRQQPNKSEIKKWANWNLIGTVSPRGVEGDGRSKKQVDCQYCNSTVPDEIKLGQLRCALTSPVRFNLTIGSVTSPADSATPYSHPSIPGAFFPPGYDICSSLQHRSRKFIHSDLSAPLPFLLSHSLYKHIFYPVSGSLHVSHTGEMITR